MSIQTLKALNKSIVKFADDVQSNTLDSVFEFVKSYVKDVDTFTIAFQEYKKEYKQNSAASIADMMVSTKKSSPVQEKKKRPASPYNIFIGEKIKELKQNNENENGKDLMKKAIEIWKEHKKKEDEMKKD